MPPRKREVQPLLGESPTVPAAAPAPNLPPPAFTEYAVDGVAWRCSQFNLLVAELGEPVITPQTLPLLHSALQGQERSWLILRRLFGLMPVTPPSSYPMEDMRSWSRADLRDALGLSAAQLKEDLDAIRGLWRKLAPPTATVQTPAPARTLFSDDALLKQFNFRIRFQDHDEESAFVQRVRDFEKLLTEKLTTGIARNALMTELQLHRLDQRLSDEERNIVGGSEWKANMTLRRELSNTYDTQMQALNKLAPWSAGITGKYNFQGVLSDITEAYQKYYADNDTALIDGIFTAAETRVECRRSVQAPEPRYRAGLVVFLNAAKAGLWNPSWQSAFKPGELARLDKAWKAAMVAAGDESGEALPDLEKTGAEGEYPSLKADSDTKA